LRFDETPRSESIFSLFGNSIIKWAMNFIGYLRSGYKINIKIDKEMSLLRISRTTPSSLVFFIVVFHALLYHHNSSANIPAVICLAG
jgi:hypothetical protein